MGRERGTIVFAAAASLILVLHFLDYKSVSSRDENSSVTRENYAEIVCRVHLRT